MDEETLDYVLDFARKLDEGECDTDDLIRLATDYVPQLVAHIRELEKKLATAK